MMSTHWARIFHDARSYFKGGVSSFIEPQDRLGGLLKHWDPTLVSNSEGWGWCSAIGAFLAGSQVKPGLLVSGPRLQHHGAQKHPPLPFISTRAWIISGLRRLRTPTHTEVEGPLPGCTSESPVEFLVVSNTHAWLSSQSHG